MATLKVAHHIVLRHLANVGTVDLRKIGESMRQRIIDLGMMDPPLVEVDADQVFLTQNGIRAANARE